jgi:hypothetical protein
MKLKRRVLSVLLIFSIFLVLSSCFVLAQDDNSDEDNSPTEIEKAYSCLEERLGDNCGDTKSTKTAAFSLLAAAYDSSLNSDCKSALMDNKKDNCWAETDSGSCTIKSTALAILALEYVGADVDDYVDWLLSKRSTNTDLIWYLQVDSNNRTQCDINGKTVTIEENKKISGTPPSGLTKAYGNYWFRINDLSKNYTVSCDRDFIAALSYQKSGSNVYHITSGTKSASEFDSVIMGVDSYCFSTSSQCDYEGSLWATLALSKAGEDKSSYIPYLSAMADKTENRKFIPAAFLYILTQSEDYYDELLDLQKTNYYWDESRNKFYDTALVLLALQGSNSNEVDSAKRYLISVQEDSGCWSSDTSFLLHSGWSKDPTSTPSSGGVSVSYCEEFNNYCVPIGDCSFSETLDNFYCPNSVEVCCQTETPTPTCSDQRGEVCDSDEECDGTSVSAIEPNCCIGDCEKIDTSNDCLDAGYTCQLECGDDQEERTSFTPDCDYGERCCEKKESGSLWWIIILIILILLVILGIFFKDRIRVWIFKRKSKVKEHKLRPSSRPFESHSFNPRPGPRPRPRPAKRRGSPRDKEFDETMRKLREMSK